MSATHGYICECLDKRCAERIYLPRHAWDNFSRMGALVTREHAEGRTMIRDLGAFVVVKTSRKYGDRGGGVTRIVTDTGPFAIVPEWLLDAGVSARAVYLYALLTRYADKGGVAWPSRATLADRLACSRDSVDRATKELEAAGALTIKRRTNEEEGNSSNLYTLFRVRHPSRTGAATPSRTGAAQNESHLEREVTLTGLLAETPFGTR